MTISSPGSNNFSLTCSASGTNSASASTSVTGVRFIDGIVFDGYIRDAQVFVDQNNNLTLDGDEVSKTTNNNGGFEDLLYANGSLVSIGGFDLDTGADLSNLTLINMLTGFEETKIVSPFTTLIAYMSESSNINQMLGINDEINLMTTDPIPLLGENIYNYMYEKGNQITVLAYALQGFFDENNSETFFQAIAAELESQYQTNQSRIDIESSSFTKKVINRVEELKNDTISQQTEANLNTMISKVIPILKVYEDASATSAVQRFAFTTLQNDLRDSSIVTNSASTTFKKYQENVLAYIASDQGISESLINPNFNVPNDGTPPTLSSLTATPSTVDVTSEAVTITLSINASDPSGVDTSRFLSFPSISKSGSPAIDADGNWTLVSGTEEDGVYQATVTVPAGTAPGSYTINSGFIYDNNGNLDSLFATGAITINSSSQPSQIYYLYGGASQSTYLGCYGCGSTNTESICNEVGTYGSSVGVSSIWNSVGTYGSTVGSDSPWNSVGLNPPEFFSNKDKTLSYGKFTINTATANRTTVTELSNILDYFISSSNNHSDTRNYACSN